MKTFQLARMVSLMALVAAIGGCGGAGDDAAGSLTEFNIQPTAFTVSGPDNVTCPGAGFIGRVFVHGGTAPYHLDNTFPDLIGLSTGTVDNEGGSFDVFSLGGGCLVPGGVLVVDKLGRQANLTVTLQKGS